MSNLKELLVDGCVVETVSKDRYMFIKSLSLFISSDTKFSLSELDDNLHCGAGLFSEHHPEYDHSIAKIYTPGMPLHYKGDNIEYGLIWDRDNIQEENNPCDIKAVMGKLKKLEHGLEVKSVGIVYTNLDIHNVTIIAKDMYSHTEIMATGTSRLEVEALATASVDMIKKLKQIRKDS